ncbi:MAG: SdrD B-like domain-containing protein, partial [Methylotenera sp.]
TSTTADNPLIAFVPGSDGLPAASVNIPVANFGGTPVFYQFKITNCGTVDLYNVRLDDCADLRSIGATGFLAGGAAGQCVEDPRLIPASPQRVVATKLSPGESKTVTSADFDGSPFAISPISTVDMCKTFGRNRSNGIIRNDSQIEADADTNNDGSGDKFVFFDDLNLVQCKETPQPTAKLGDRVWVDLNGDGIQNCTDAGPPNGIIGDAGDTGPECGKGVPNTTVNLRTPDNQGNCSGGVLQTRITNSQGFYLFDNLTPGNYCVQFDKPNICDGNTAPAYFTKANAGGDVADSDANPQTGLTGAETLAAGQSNLTVDAGVYCPAKLGDRVWLDDDQDGNQDCSGVIDPLNPGQVIPGTESNCTEPTFTTPVPVSLTDCAGGSALNITGGTVSPVTTSNGRYLFDNLRPGGSYCVQFTKPAGYNCTTPNASGVGYQVNSDGLPTADFCTTGPVPLLSGGDDRSWDLGLVLPPPACNLKVNKTCAVIPPPPSTSSFVCSNAKPLDVLTMINGSGQTVSNIRVYRDKYDPKNPAKNLMYTLAGPFANGAEITAPGYAGASAVNDVDWVFQANGATYISRFHRSCSDPDMNGPEDCGKLQGNAKSTSTSLQGLPVLNSWALEGMAGKGLELNCTVDPVQTPFPSADACITTLKNQPSCLTEGKPKELVFK